MLRRKKCKCGSERVLVKPAWYNKFKVPTWVCIAKSCPYPRSPEVRMGAKQMLSLLLEGFFRIVDDGDFVFCFKEDTGIGDFNKELQRNLKKFCEKNKIYQ